MYSARQSTTIEDLGPASNRLKLILEAEKRVLDARKDAVRSEIRNATSLPVLVGTFSYDIVVTVVDELNAKYPNDTHKYKVIQNGGCVYVDIV